MMILRNAWLIVPRGLAATALVTLLFAATSPPAASAGEPGPAAAVSEAEEAPEPVAAETGSAERHVRIRLLGTGAIVDGDSAQFQQQNRIPDNISGGIDDFHFDTELSDDTDLTLDGRAIFDNHDYLVRLRILNEDKGSLDVGYRQFRTWYDGRGGYLPFSDAAFVVFDPELGVDRGEAWAKGTLLLPKAFKLTMGYRYLSRDGSKSSLTWGDSTSPELPSQRDIVPAFWRVNEQRHQAEIALSRETETSEVGAAVRYEHMDLDNDRNVTRNPGQVGLERRFTQNDNNESDMVVAHAFGSKQLWDNRLTISGAYAYNDLDLSLGGSRVYGATFNAPFSPFAPNRQQRDEGFLDLTGSADMHEHVGNLSFAATPFKDVQILSALRIRGEERKAHADFTETNVGGAPTFTTTLEDLRTESDTDEMSYAEDLEIRYKGIENIVLYARALWEENDGDLDETEIEVAAALVDLDRRTDIDRLLQNYSVGVKAYPSRHVHLSAEYAYRMSDYSYTHDVDSTPNDAASADRYPAFLTGQQLATHDVSLRTTLRLPADVGLVLRYDWLQTTIDTRADELDHIQSAQTRTHLIGSTLTWNPAPWWWTRAGVNYVLSVTDTAANNYETPVASFLRSFENDYVTTNLMTGFAVDDATEVELGYGWMYADNYHDVSAAAVPYGSDFTQHSVMGRASHRFDEHTKLTGGYSYTSYDEAFAGGNYDYHAHLIFTAVELEY